MVENAKSILKWMFHELLGKTKLHIIFVHGTMTWCALLHNLFIARKEINMDKIMNTLAKKTKVEQLWRIVECPPNW
jgi:hypothetical protein